MQPEFARVFPIAKYVLAGICVGFWGFMMFNGISSVIVSYVRYTFKPKSKSSKMPKDVAPGVSILRPLKGVDENLAENLESSFQLDYPNFEIILSCRDPDDPAVKVATDLIRKFPAVDAKIITGGKILVSNPKVSNLLESYSMAKNEIVWILDSNVLVNKGTLCRAVDCLTADCDVGLVHHIPIGINPHTFGAAMERLYLNTFHAKVYTMVNKLQMGSCVIGKSIMFRKRELQHLGGIKYFGKFMSEDNVIGQKLWERGRRHVIPADVVYQQLGHSSLAEYFKRRMRWTRIRKYTVLVATLIEPFTECLLNGLIGAFGFSVFFQVPKLPFFLAHVANWFITDILFVLAVEKSMLADNFPRYLSAWCVREITSFPCHIFALLGSSVEWRGKKYKLRSDGTVIEDSSKLCTSATSSNLRMWLIRIFLSFGISSLICLLAFEVFMISMSSVKTRGNSSSFYYGFGFSENK